MSSLKANGAGDKESSCRKMAGNRDGTAGVIFNLNLRSLNITSGGVYRTEVFLW